MSDPADRHLEQRLHALAGDISVPVVPAEQDVRRGRRRLRRLRVAMAGASTGTLAVVLGFTALTAGRPTATELPPVTRPPSSLPATPSATPSQEPEAGRQETEAGRAVGRAGSGGPAGGTSGGSAPPAVDPTPGLPGTTAVRDPGEHGSEGKPHHGQGSFEPSGGASEPTESGGVDPTPSDPATPTETELPSGTPTPSEEPTDPPTVPPTETSPVRVHKVLRFYQAVLAEHVDPEGDRLQPYDRRTGRPKSTRDGETFFALGARYRWADGEPPAGLAVRVASGWDQVVWECGASYSDWSCHVPEGDAVAEVGVHDGVREVAVEHPDGQVVVLAATGVDIDEAVLVDAAADDRLTLPGEAAVAPPRLDPAAFATTGVAALVLDEETFAETVRDRSPQVRGTWTADGVARGTLAWSAQPRYSGAGWTCQRTYRSCRDVVVDEAGTTVHVGQLKKRGGGGWVVQYDGPSYSVRVYSSDRTFPRKRAVALVTMADWQPTA